MSWSTITAEDALGRLATGAVGLDVRSEGEFASGALPGFVNIPVLNDEHRHQVGLTYKQRGPSVAQALGRDLVEPLRENLVERWRDAVAVAPPARRLLICWRGGLRSESVADELHRRGVEGVRVTGGYKAVRHLLLGRAADPPPLVVLTGLTGSGKTDLLRDIPGALDLEACARHRGSAFGLDIDVTQPAQQTFENLVGFSLWTDAGPRVVEDESAMIGRNVVPEGLRKRMIEAPLVVLEVDARERAERSFEEYVRAPSARFGRARTRAHVLGGVRSVANRLGGLRTREITAALEGAFDATELVFENFEPPITRLLTEYYDPMYAHGRERRPRRVLFSGTRADVRAFLLTRPGA